MTTWKLDAAAKGCSGMFYRTKPEMNALSGDANWPRNGTILQGEESKEHPGWVSISGTTFWMPIVQDGVTVMHQQE